MGRRNSTAHWRGANYLSVGLLLPLPEPAVATVPCPLLAFSTAWRALGARELGRLLTPQDKISCIGFAQQGKKALLQPSSLPPSLFYMRLKTSLFP